MGFRSLQEARESCKDDGPLFSWGDILDIVRRERLDILGRRGDEEERYQAWTHLIKKQDMGGMEKYILIKKLNWTSLELEEGIVQRRYGFFDARMGDTLVKIVRNDWPYSLTEDIQHWVIWCRVPLFEESEVEQKVYSKGICGTTGMGSVVNIWNHDSFSCRLYTFVIKHWPESQYETCYFLNPPRLQSVKGLNHFHVLSRAK